MQSAHDKQIACTTGSRRVCSEARPDGVNSLQVDRSGLIMQARAKRLDGRGYLPRQALLESGEESDQ